jgi:oligoribonuclease NrnB/cAMP/cGMP phosphodiesterase (DHH superfamily)
VEVVTEPQLPETDRSPTIPNNPLPERPRICVYHDNCHDGITAAWVVQHRFGCDVELYPARYEHGPDLERLAGRDVIIVDFSWKRPQIEDVHEAAASLFVIDHHQSAEAELAGLDYCRFDMQRSGCGLAWDELFRDLPPPRLVQHVEDRDLWRFRLPNTREIHAATNLRPLTIEARRLLVACCEDAECYEKLVEQGRTVLEYHTKLVESATRYRPRNTIHGYDVPCVACPVVELISDVGHVLAKGEPFAAVFSIKDDMGILVSLRSDDDGVDVSEIARAYGGGGHKHAAGFHLAPGAILGDQ